MSPDENVGIMESETTYMGSIWHPLSSTVNPIVTATLQNRTLPSTEHRTERKRFTTGTSGDFVEWSFRGCLFDSMPTAHIIDKQRPGRMCVRDFSSYTGKQYRILSCSSSVPYLQRDIVQVQYAQHGQQDNDEAPN